MWDVEQYERFSAFRDRPFHDMLGRVSATSPAYVVDLGCGSGGQTAALACRWPHARVEGVDSSAAMLAAADARATGGRLTFTKGDIANWSPSMPVDVLVSNAAFQWVPGHVELLERFVGWLTPGGWFAFQVPGNHGEAAHRLLAELRQSTRWADRVGAGADRRRVVRDPGEYLELLAGLGCRVDAWETTYHQVLAGEDAVLEWMKGTALRPVFERLEERERADFVAEFGELLRTAYPRRSWGTVLPFRRIFVVAHRAR